jgi:hypothetical protein
MKTLFKIILFPLWFPFWLISLFVPSGKVDKTLEDIEDDVDSFGEDL